MEIIVETTYDHSAMKALSKGLRKTLRRKRSRRSHFLGIIVMFLGLILLISKGTIDLQSTITAAAIIAIFLSFLFEDDLNGQIARKRGLPGLDSAVTIFREENYHSVTALGETTFCYDKILALAETREYFLLLFSPNHGQVYSKAGMTHGSEVDFKEFLEEKTKLAFVQI